MRDYPFKRLLYLYTALVLFVLFVTLGLKPETAPIAERPHVADNPHYFAIGHRPFFWLGDTGWLLFSKLNREETETYLTTRKNQGFNVIQVMVIHDLKDVNAYGDSALMNRSVTTPKTTPGNRFGKGNEYDFWDHIDWVVKRAAEKGLYIAMVPVWGSVVKGSKMTPAQGKQFAAFLATRYRTSANVIWMNGGDIKGSQYAETWDSIGETLHQLNPISLITYHPIGRGQSSTWFHDRSWLSFNCFQSGHQDYAQDTTKDSPHYGEDNWRYVQGDYAKAPVKPTLDAEPSYEDIPHGLHDTLQPRWNANDVRRYAYWSVFAGACGHTYGNNDVIQMHQPADKVAAYGSRKYWYQAINDAGAMQMQYLKKLMLSRPYFERVPDQTLIAGKPGERYDRPVATRGKNYAFIYTYNGRDMQIDARSLGGKLVKAAWYNPRNGKTTAIGVYPKKRVLSFHPQGTKMNGNDWVLMLDSF